MPTMDITASAKGAKRLLLATLLPALVMAGELRVEPAVTLAPYYTTNVERSADAQESLVTQLQPSILLVGLGRDYRAALDYGYNHNFYSDDSDANSGYNTLAASADYLLAQGIYAFATADIAQQSTNPEDGLLVDSGNRGGNISDTESYSGGLRAMREGYWMRGGGELAGRYVASDSGNFETTKGYDGNLMLQQGVGAGPWFYDLRGDASQERSDGLDVYQSEQLDLRGGYSLWRGFGLYARFYQDQARFGEASRNRLASAGGGVRFSPGPQLTFDLGYNAVTSGDADDYVDARLVWLPSSRSRLEANYGHRYFGDSWGLLASHGTRKLQQSLSYREEISTTSRALTLGIPFARSCPPGVNDPFDPRCVAASQEAPDGYKEVEGQIPIDAIDNSVYLSQLWLYSLNLDLRTQQWQLNLYQDERSQASDLLDGEHYEDRGARLDWRLRLSERSALESGGVARSYRRDQQLDRDREWLLRLALVRTPNSYSRWSLETQYFDRDAQQQDASYDEWRLGLSYTYYL